MTSALASTRQDDFSGGSNVDHAPHRIDPRAVYRAVNALCDDEGSLYRRGGSVNKSSAAFGTSLRFGWDGYLKPGRRTVFANTADFGVLDADDVTVRNLGGTGLTLPAAAAEHRGLLFLPGGDIYGGSRKTTVYSTGTLGVTLGNAVVTKGAGGLTANVDAGMLLRVAGARAYVVASVDSDTQLTLEDPYEGATNASVAFSLSPLITNPGLPYQSAPFYAVCADRLIWAFENKVRFGALGNPHTPWDIDDEHELPQGARIIGFGVAGQTLLIFSTNGTWALDGLGLSITDTAGNAQHQLRQFSPDLVGWGSAGIASWQGAVVVPCLDGIWLIDGISTPRELGHPVEALYRSYIALGHRPGGAAVYNSHYFLPVLDVAGNWIDTLVCRLDRPIRVLGKTTYPWTFLADAGGKCSAFARRAVDTGATALLGFTNPSTARVVDCSYFFLPDGTHKNDADGTTHVFEMVSRDFELDMSVVRKILARYVLIDAGSDNPSIRLDRSSGAKLPTGTTLWNGFNWNGANWPATGFSDTDWTPVAGAAASDDGQHPATFHVNKRLRFARLRITSVGPSARFILRGLELFFRPTGKLR